MALLTRELELIIIARDHTQSTTARVAGALTFIGAAITRMGLAWAATLRDMTDEAIDFRNGAALAFTQMFDQGTATITDIEQAMLRVGKEVPVPFEEMSEAMFDIFSSLEATVPEAESILRAVSQAAVAGQTDVRGAMVPTIAMMNAFGLGAEDIGFILDQQFTTVQRGILTYGEFTQTIGKVIPAAKSSGQTIETMGAAVAFLTRNGLSAAMAGTSAARAFELFAQPKTVKNLEDAGIAVRDSTGEFRQINEVLADMDSIFGNLTAPERKEKFIEIFGQGRIQARRFFDIAIPNWREFNDLVEVFTSEETVGAMRRAYDVMMEQPRQKLDVLRNRWEALRIEIGMRFIPLLEDKIIPFFQQLLDIWEGLDEVQKDNLVRWAAIGALATTVAGILTVIIGVGKLLVAVFGATGFIALLGSMLGPLLKFLGIIGLLVGAGFLIVKNWDKVVDFWNNTLEPAVKRVIEFFRPLVEEIVDKVIEKWDELLTFFGNLVDEWIEFFDELVPEIAARFEGLPDDLRRIFEKAGDVVGPFFDALMALVSFISDVVMKVLASDEFLDTLTFIWETAVAIVEIGLELLEGALEVFTFILEGDWGAAWDRFLQIFVDVWNIIMRATKGIRKWFIKIWQGIMTWFHDTWNDAWEAVSDFFSGIWEGIKDIASGVIDWFQDTWNAGWEAVTTFFSDIWTGIQDIASGVLEWFQNTWNAGWEAITNFFSTVWGGIKDFFMTVWEGIVSWFQGLWENRIVQFLVIVLQIIWELIRIAFLFVLKIIVDAVKGMWNTIVSTWNNIKDFLTLVLGLIVAIVVPIWDFIFATVKTIVTNIWDVIVIWFNKAKEFIGIVWNIVLGIVVTIWDFIFATVKTIVTNIWTTIVIWWNKAKEFIRTTMNIIVGIVGPIWDSIWSTIKTVVSNIWRSIVFWWNIIKGFLGTLWDNLKIAAGIVWEGIKDKIIDPVKEAWEGVRDFFNKIKNKLDWLLDEAIKLVTKIRNWLRKLNPFSQSSIPIAVTILQGFDVLGSDMVDRLAEIEKDARARVIRIRNEVSNLRKITTPEFGGGLALAPVAGGGNIEINVTTTAEQEIADEIAWAIRIR